MNFLHRTTYLRGLISMTHDNLVETSANTLNKLLDSGELLTVKEAARLADYTGMGIRMIAERGHIREIRVGHACFVLRSELEAYLRERGKRPGA